MLRFLGRVLFIGLVVVGAYALWKRLTNPTADGLDFEQGRPLAPAAASTAPSPVAPWVEPDAGACPVSHPVKAKLTSGIFHMPGGQNYDRTKADRCYVDARGAEADGLRQAKR